jgi:hypothetical protein
MTSEHDIDVDPDRTREWALRWKAAWETNWASGTLRDVLPLYAEGAVFRTVPHRDADVGPEAIGNVFDTFQAAATDVVCRFGEPLVSGSRAVVEWWASWTEDGDPMSMAGISTIWFDEAGLVAESRDYWNVTAAKTEPYEGW